MFLCMYVCTCMFVCVHTMIYLSCVCAIGIERRVFGSVWSTWNRTDCCHCVCIILFSHGQQFYCNTDPQVTNSKHPTTANVILWHNTFRLNTQPIFQRYKRILSSLFSLWLTSYATSWFMIVIIQLTMLYLLIKVNMYFLYCILCFSCRDSISM